MRTTLVFALLATVATGATADATRGEALHEENCTQCHGTEVYTREEHFVTSIDELTAQVQRCDKNVGTQWNEQQIQDVVNYLNEAFYRFE